MNRRSWLAWITAAGACLLGRKAEAVTGCPYANTKAPQAVANITSVGVEAQYGTSVTKWKLTIEGTSCESPTDIPIAVNYLQANKLLTEFLEFSYKNRRHTISNYTIRSIS